MGGSVEPGISKSPAAALSTTRSSPARGGWRPIPTADVSGTCGVELPQPCGVDIALCCSLPLLLCSLSLWRVVGRTSDNPFHTILQHHAAAAAAPVRRRREEEQADAAPPPKCARRDIETDEDVEDE